MPKQSFEKAIDSIVAKNPKYSKEAYFLLRDSLDFTLETQRSNELAEHRHVSGPEFLQGLRDYSIKQFGSMSLPVLESWGIESGSDVGNMVYLLIDAGVFGRSEDDHPNDFEDWEDFKEAFQGPFRPKKKVLAGFDLNENHGSTTNSQQTAKTNDT